MSVRHAIIAVALTVIAEIVMLVSFAAWPNEISPAKIAQAAQVAATRDAEILARCMNGQFIALEDGEVMTCQIRRVKK
jgi:hypothetical protein